MLGNITEAIWDLSKLTAEFERQILMAKEWQCLSTILHGLVKWEAETIFVGILNKSLLYLDIL